MPRHALRHPAPELDPDVLADLALAPATHDAYARGLRHFARWCGERGHAALPASEATIRAFVASETSLGFAPATLRQRLAAVHYHHGRAGLLSPVRDPLAVLTARGAGRHLAVGRGTKQAAAFEPSDLLHALTRLSDDMQGLRDRALLALMVAGALRESEAVGVRVADLRDHPHGFRVWLPQSKGDRAGTGCWQVACDTPFLTIAVREHVQAWLTAAGVSEGPLFRGLWRGGRAVRRRALSRRAVDVVIQRAARAASLSAAQFSGHSPRATWITAAFAAAAPAHEIMAHARHRSMEQTLTYRRDRIGPAQLSTEPILRAVQ